jgi:putative hemolysin
VVTLTDIFEALVGNIPTAGDRTEPAVVRREDGSWLVDGLAPLEEIADVVGVTGLPEGANAEYYTIGGFIMSLLGRIPVAGDRVDWEGRRFEVVDMDGNRVDKVIIAQAPPSLREE